VIAGTCQQHNLILHHRLREKNSKEAPFAGRLLERRVRRAILSFRELELDLGLFEHQELTRPEV
jgi:hypothetical protein